MSESKKKITIYDVADEAKVTIATVSRVINGKDNVASDTKRKVMKAIEKLNYYPSPIASGLSKSKSQEIGILVPFFFGEFFINLLSGVMHSLTEYDPVLYNAATPEKKKKLTAKIVGEGKIDGLIIVSLPVLLEDEILLQNAKFPIVLIDNKNPAYQSVCFDNVFGAYHAVEHLIENGHKRIGMITGAAEDPFHFTTAKDRLKGYRMALSMAEIPVNEKYIEINDWTKEGAKLLARRMLTANEPPTAIFAVSDLQAIGVIEAAHELGLSVPDDLSVVGYDNMAFSEYQGLTTVSQPLAVASQIASDKLYRLMSGEILAPETIVLQPAIIERKTVKPIGGR